ncbi:MAG: prepilin-type N-terminal cleavage/methylation domain-containing protein [Deltaproteobacteria bacterium]|nr:prepilin-type N-terminal cleavage/methylation domain-containing protein [Deltaproteobacteria bacterium]
MRPFVLIHAIRHRQGFTTLELVVALAIVGVLYASFYMSAKWARDRALHALFMADIRQVKIAATRFETDIGFFPPDVWRNVDPGLIAKNGWAQGGHSAKWETPDLSDWRGPYLENWPVWKRNPWGGTYDWDNYEPGYEYMGIPGGAVYLTLKPSEWGGRMGLPKPDFEARLQEMGIDKSPWPHVVSVQMGVYRNTDLTGGH